MDTPRCAVFIDGNNLFHAASQINVEIDYSKLLAFMVGDSKHGSERVLYKAMFYTCVDEANDRQKGFLHWMSCNGFKVFKKPVNMGGAPNSNNGNGSYQTKKNRVDVEIATDMMRMMDKYDVCILVAGGEDYCYPVKMISDSGKFVEVYSFKSSVSSKLIEVADKYTDLEEHRNAIDKNPPNYVAHLNEKSTEREAVKAPAAVPGMPIRTPRPHHVSLPPATVTRPVSSTPDTPPAIAATSRVPANIKIVEEPSQDKEVVVKRGPGRPRKNF